MTILPSNYDDAPAFIKTQIEEELYAKNDLNLLELFMMGSPSKDPEILKRLRKEYRRYRRHWKRLDVKQQKIKESYNNTRQQILDDLPW